MFRKRQIIGTMYIMMTVIVVGIIAACTPCVVREAQTVVAEADSLRAEGQMYSDSVQLAEACAIILAVAGSGSMRTTMRMPAITTAVCCALLFVPCCD